MCHSTNSHPPLFTRKEETAIGEELVIRADDGNQFAAFLAHPKRPTGRTVLIYPDVRGVHQFYKELSLCLAEEGITALVVDYFGRTAGLTPRDDTFLPGPHIAQLQPTTFLADASAALSYLRRELRTDQSTFVLGFCLGGSLSLYTATEPTFDLVGAISFYAGLSFNMGKETFLEASKRIRWPVLGLFAGADEFIPAGEVEALDHHLKQRQVEHELVMYPGAPHGFFDRSALQWAEVPCDAWQRTLDFIWAHTCMRLPNTLM